MTWPIASDYNDVIQFPKTCFGDVHLKNGTVKVDRFGLPIATSGMFASVYEMNTSAGRWAVKCFLKPVEDHQRRYAAISAHLKAIRLKAAVGFEFIPEGVRVRSQWYPILKMEWIDGEPINDYVAKNLGQPHKLLQLTRDWVEMMASLRAAQVAHGDLQHGNVLVTPSGLRLIDYDGMYVPALNGLVSHEEGHRNYQHPARNGHDFGPYLDNFSAWVIFSSVTAVALDPRLWQILNGGDECLLFRREDFQRPDQSRAFQILESSRPEIKALTGQFRAMLSMPIRQIPALNGRIVPQPTGEHPRSTMTPGPLPDWLAEHVPAASRVDLSSHEPLPIEEEGPAMAAAADWIIDHLVDQSTPVPSLRTHSFLTERLALFLTFCVISVTGWTAMVSVLPLMAGAVVILVTVGAFIVLLMARYRLVSGIQERKATNQLLRTARKALEMSQSEVEAAGLQRNKLTAPLDALETEFRRLPQKINEELRAVQSRIDGTRETFARKRKELASEEGSELRAMEQDIRRRLAPLQIERNGLDKKERDELTGALTLLQEAHVNARLANRLIEGASIPGLGPKLKARLKDGGIVTAFDVDIWRVRNIDGIGGTKGTHLMQWKNSIIQHITVPLTLPNDQVQCIRSQFTRHRQELDQQIRAGEEADFSQRKGILDRFVRQRAMTDEEERRAIAPLDTTIREIHLKLQRDRLRIDGEYRKLKTNISPARKEHEQKISELSRRTMQQRFEVCKLEKELERYKGLSPKWYLTRTIGLGRVA